VCPACASAELARIGAGTQRLERELEAALPGLRRFRLDADTVEQRGVAETLRAFAGASSAALIGTQMVAKGHHFTGVALAAVVDADTGLGLPDFRAEERTFQLLTQLAGRSGRDAPGRVLVQTFQPDARAIQLAARHDVAGFLAGELERRRELTYPPFRHLVRVVVSGPEEGLAERVLSELKAGLPDDVLGPAVPGAARREDGSPARGCIVGGPPARGGGSSDATGRAPRSGRRRPAEPLITLAS
jgi:primosomal protein N' (replication factor Y)